ncbi:hypothetical protein FZEAL_6376 [Fusarium zealandicum]|uniref:Zn(2)-C6 fungal-type domain-containing protein n=1 Tax=Fusarium zealandicum TaxID=1053134 RepID=A0A8H4UI26_9HYPO|nr:hypothetical protein FZEAL_6376 [Fusarium zealandicum]
MPGPELAQFTGVFRTKDAHRITRNRKPISCAACQKRKSKCDRVKPFCGACQKRGDSTGCVYGETPGLAGRQEMQAKVAKLEAIVKRLAASSESSCLQKSLAAHNTDGGGLDASSPAMEMSDAAYHGETSWEAVFQSIQDIQSGLDHEEDMEETDPADETENQAAPDIVLGSVAPITIEDIRSSMPPRHEADKLVDIYFNAKFLAVPFVHYRHFWRRYALFWDTKTEPNFLWMSIMFSVLSLGAMIATVMDPRPGSASRPKLFMHRAAQCLITGEYLNAKVYSVEALMLFAHSRNVQKEDSDATIWSLYALALRLAQRRGYHLDAARVSPNIKPFEAEMRRRTWFMIQSSDCLFSLQLGMPPMIFQDVCDAGHPRNLDDDEFDEDTDVPESRPPTHPTPLLAWNIKSKMCPLLRQVLRHTLTIEPHPYEETMRLHAELEAFHESIPPCFRIRSICDTSPDDQGYTIMHRLILEVSYLKTLCVLHRPYLSVDKDEDQYRASREICRAAALRIVDLHLEVDREIRPGRRMYNDRFMVTSLTLHDFLAAAMIVCLDLSESTDISPHERHHSIQMLQRAHSVWKERGAKSKDARHGARVLRAILGRVNSSAPSTVSDTTTYTSDGVSSVEYTYSEPCTTEAVLDFSDMQLTEFPIGYNELLPIDNFFASAEGFDWGVGVVYINMQDSCELE